MKKRTLLLILLLPAFFMRVGAQYTIDLKRTADIDFSKGNYYSAAQYYEKYLQSRMGKEVQDKYSPYSVAYKEKEKKNDRGSAEYERVIYRLAESYRLYLDFVNAEKWYGQALSFNQQNYPYTRLWYGVCLRTNKKYAEAEDAYTDFLNSYAVKDEYRSRAVKELANTKFIRQQLDHPAKNIYLSKLSQPTNGSGANYAPVWISPDSLVFTSTRVDSGRVNKKNKDPYLNSLYLVTNNNATKLDIPEAANFHQGVSAFSNDHQKMYFTRWELQNAKNMANIYVSTRTATGWSDPKKMSSVNVDGYSSQQPFMIDKYLVFSSDRPGGAGKYDLWYVELDPMGNPGEAVNLGLSLNTSEDDEAPFYHPATKTLIFASNGRTGMGGFDLYQSKGDIFSWSEPQNLGYPINSVKDDIYFFSASQYSPMSKAYISSDRNSVCCLEIFELHKQTMMLNGLVRDCGTRQPLGDVKVTLIDTVEHKEIFSSISNAAGAYNFELDRNGPYRVVAELPGYNTRNESVRYNSSQRGDSSWIDIVCLDKPKPAPEKPYPVNKAVILKDIFYDFNKATLRPESYPALDKVISVMNDFPNMEVELSAFTDSKGTDAYNQKLSDARASSCVSYMISKGISKDRLAAKGMGECCAVAPNTINGKDNPDGRALNRRTEIKILHY